MYKVYSYSKVKFVLLWFAPLILICVLVVLLIVLLGPTWGLVLGSPLLIFVVVYWDFLPKRFAKSILQIDVEKDGVSVVQHKPSVWAKPRESLRFELSELKSYKYEPSLNFTTFKLRTKSGEVCKIHSYHKDSDDFDKFITACLRRVKAYNERKSTTTFIEREKVIMENKSFLIAVVSIIVALIVWATYGVITSKAVNPTGIIYLCMVLGPLVWVVKNTIKGLNT